jgi:chaperone modulatory protein CbpM
VTSPRHLPARVHSDRLDLEEFARRCGLHPGLVRRFVALGLVPAVRDRDGRLWFGPSQVAAVARLLRLRATLPLNYAALGLVADLLDRITVLETALRIRGHSDPVRPRAPVRHSARLTTGTTPGTTTPGTTTTGTTTTGTTTGRPRTADQQEEWTSPWT